MPRNFHTCSLVERIHMLFYEWVIKLSGVRRTVKTVLGLLVSQSGIRISNSLFQILESKYYKLKSTTVWDSLIWLLVPDSTSRLTLDHCQIRFLKTE